MDIREAGKTDIQEILRLIEDSYTPYKDSIKDIDIPEYSYDEIQALLAEPQSDIWVAAENDKIIGMAAGTEFGPCAYHLKMMFVLGESQHRGVGSALLETFEERPQDEPITKTSSETPLTVISFILEANSSDESCFPRISKVIT